MIETYREFIEKLKVVKQIKLFKDDVLRCIEYSDNYGCTINTYTSNGNCGFVYNEYLHLISNGFEEVDKQQEDKYTIDNPLDMGLKYHYGSKSKYFILYEEDGLYWWALGGVNHGTREPIPRVLYDYLVMFREENSIPRLYKTHFDIR